MGIDLRLFLVKQPWMDSTWCGDSIKLDPAYELFSQIKNMGLHAPNAAPPIAQPQKLRPETTLYFCGEEGGGDVTVDEYNEPLTFLWPEDLLKLDWSVTVSPWNQAIKAFLEKLPPEPEVAVVLYWC